MSWGCPRGASEGLSSCCTVKGRRGADKSFRLSILLIIYGSCVCEGGHFQGFVRVTMTFSSDCFCFSSGVQGLDVEQSPPVLSLQEGASHVLRCNFSASVNNVQWYLQNPSGRLIHLFYIPSGTKQDGRLNATTIPTERRRSLHISSSQTTDSGTYFCAVQHSAPQAPAASTQTLRRAQHLLQPQSHREATTGHLQCGLFLTCTGTVLITDTFWPYRL